MINLKDLIETKEIKDIRQAVKIATTRQALLNTEDVLLSKELKKLKELVKKEQEQTLKIVRQMFSKLEDYMENGIESEEHLLESARAYILNEFDNENSYLDFKNEDGEITFDSVAYVLSVNLSLRYMREALYRNNEKENTEKWNKQLFLDTIAETIDSVYPSVGKPSFIFEDERDGTEQRISFKFDEENKQVNFNLFGEKVVEADVQITEEEVKELTEQITFKDDVAEVTDQVLDVSKFYNQPTSPVIHFMNEVMISATNLGNLPSRKKNVSKGATYNVRNDGNRYELSYTKGKDKVVLEVTDIELFLGKRNQAKKMFNYSLIKANQQILNNGELIGDTISFPLQELVDLGMYKDVKYARAGWNKSVEALTSLKAKGHIRSRNQDTLEVLFTGGGIKKGRCYLHFNYRIDWNFIVQYYTIIPKYYFKLSNRSADLLQAIFYLGRQQVNESGKFNISFRTIQQVLNLPNENNTKNPQRDIKDVIESAIEEIEENHSQEFSNKDFQLLPIYDENANIVNYLEDGYLQVTLKGEYLGKFKEIKHKQAKRIEQNKSKKK